MIYQASSSNGARLCLLFGLNSVEAVKSLVKMLISIPARTRGGYFNIIISSTE